MIIILCVETILAGFCVNANAATKYAKSGVNKYGDKWKYNEESSTLVISPSKTKAKKKNNKAFKHWTTYAKNIEYKDGVTRLSTIFPFELDFGSGNVRNLKIPGSIKTIDEDAFEMCQSLSKVKLGDGVEYIGNGAFGTLFSSEFKSIKLPKSVKYIGSEAFRFCKLETIDIPDSVEFIGPEAFRDCQHLKSVKLPDRITAIRSLTFAGDKILENCVIPESVHSIECGAFMGTAMEEVVIPRNVEVLGSVANWDIERNGEYSIFGKCKKLKKIKIVSKKLSKIYPEALSGINDGVVIEVPIGYKDKYAKMFEEGGLNTNVVINEINIEDNDVDYVYLNKDNVTIKSGMHRRLELVDADNPEEVQWTSSNDDIATVDSSGNVVAKEIGTTSILATYKNQQFKCDVTVGPADEDNDKKALKKLIKYELKRGADCPEDIYDKAYDWYDGRLVGINWEDCRTSGAIDLNAFTHLEYFICGTRDGYEDNYVWRIDADNLAEIKYIKCPWWLADNYNLVSVENAPNVKVTLDWNDYDYEYGRPIYYDFWGRPINIDFSYLTDADYIEAVDVED